VTDRCPEDAEKVLIRGFETMLVIQDSAKVMAEPSNSQQRQQQQQLQQQQQQQQSGRQHSEQQVVFEKELFFQCQTLEELKEAHDLGRCKPCRYFAFKADGCRSGDKCSYCHLCNSEDCRRSKAIWKKQQLRYTAKAKAAKAKAKSDQVQGNGSTPP
ncbi:unnamed protein product, partial [Polarella glacialis]